MPNQATQTKDFTDSELRNDVITEIKRLLKSSKKLKSLGVDVEYRGGRYGTDNFDTKFRCVVDVPIEESTLGADFIQLANMHLDLETDWLGQVVKDGEGWDMRLMGYDRKKRKMNYIFEYVEAEDDGTHARVKADLNYVIKAFADR